MRALNAIVMLASFAALGAWAQQTLPAPPPPSAQKVPVMDAGVGPCAVELTVTTSDGKPVYAADVKVHIAYGFAGLHKLDLEAGTDQDGKVKFIGLPAKVHNAPLEFHASKGELVGVANDDPRAECDAKHDIFLEKPKPQPPANP